MERARTRHYAQALGLLYTLHAPQLREWVYPEAYAIEAKIYVDHCYYRRAEAIASAFRTEVLPLRTASSDPRLARRLAEDGTLDRLRGEIDAAEVVLDRIVDQAHQQRVKLLDAEDDREVRRPPTIVPAGAQLWRFDGSFWPDELGHYVVALQSRCRLR